MARIVPSVGLGIKKIIADTIPKPEMEEKISLKQHQKHREQNPAMRIVICSFKNI